jgi:hypothetical protein
VRGLHPDRRPTIVAGRGHGHRGRWSSSASMPSRFPTMTSCVGRALEVVHRARRNGALIRRHEPQRTRGDRQFERIRAPAGGARGPPPDTPSSPLLLVELDVCLMARPIVRRRTIAALAKGCSCRHGVASPAVSLIGSGESRIESAPPAARTVEPAPSWHVPLPVLSGPTLEAASGRLPSRSGRRGSSST